MSINVKRICFFFIEGIAFSLLAAVFIALILCEAYGVSYRRGFYCDDESVRFPYKKGSVPTSVLVIFSVALPIIILPCGNFLESKKNGSLRINWKKSPLILLTFVQLKWYFTGLLLTLIVTDSGKLMVGRLRPHFLDVCKPDFTMFNCTDGIGNPVYVTDYECFGNSKMISDARLSWPSGHSSITAYAFTFFAVYASCIKVMPPRTILRALLILISMLAALLTGYSRISDNKHHPTDVLSGWLIGFTISGAIVYYNLHFFRKQEKQEKQETNIEHIDVKTESDLTI